MQPALLVCLLLTIAAKTAAVQPDSLGHRREEVRFASADFVLVGDLLTPPGAGPHPAILYVWGSGPTNRKRHIETSPVLQRFLNAGFAVFLYDKPGSGQSTGEFDNRHVFAQRASILIEAIAQLKARPEIDARAIGLYGSSQASYVIAATLAKTTEIAFLIAWSCPMQNSLEQSAYLVGNYVLCEGGTQAEADAARAAYRRRGQARTYSEYRAAAEFLDGIPAIRDGLGWAGVATQEQFTPADPTSESFLDPSAGAPMRFPVLAVFAENDRQVDPVQGAAAFQSLFAAGAHPLSKVVVIAGADHNMNLSPRGCMQDQVDGYRSVGGKRLSPVFLETVATWLVQLKPELGERGNE